MIDDDGYDGIRSHGVDPDWNPFSTPRDDDPDDIGWDDGSETPHANPSRMSGKGVAVLTACTLVMDWQRCVGQVLRGRVPVR